MELRVVDLIPSKTWLRSLTTDNQRLATTVSAEGDLARRTKLSSGFLKGLAFGFAIFLAAGMSEVLAEESPKHVREQIEQELAVELPVAVVEEIISMDPLPLSGPQSTDQNLNGSDCWEACDAEHVRCLNTLIFFATIRCRARHQECVLACLAPELLSSLEDQGMRYSPDIER